MEKVNRQQQPISTLEDFKKNCGLLESALCAGKLLAYAMPFFFNSFNFRKDLDDPRGDLKKLESWIVYVGTQVAHDNSQQMLDFYKYLFNECLPRVIRGLLRRNYSNNEAHIEAVRDFLQSDDVIKRVVGDFKYSMEGLPSVITELLDPSQPFYSKFGFPKPKKIPEIKALPAVAVVDDDSWKQVIGTDSCFDGYSPAGLWEMVCVEEISPTRTEVRVSWSTGEQEWLSLSNDDRVAPFDTRSNLSTESNSTDTTASTTPSTGTGTASISVDTDTDYSGDAPQQGSGSKPQVGVAGASAATAADGANGNSNGGREKQSVSMSTVNSTALWETCARPEVGSFVDVLDMRQIWRQACIMEIQEIY
eukprot:gene1787-3470_t